MTIGKSSRENAKGAKKFFGHSARVSRLRGLIALIWLLSGIALLWAAHAQAHAPVVTLEPAAGPVGTDITILATGFDPDRDAEVFWDGDSIGAIHIDSSSNAQINYTVPEGAQAGPHQILVFCSTCQPPFGEMASAWFSLLSPPDTPTFTPTPPTWTFTPALPTFTPTPHPATNTPTATVTLHPPTGTPSATSTDLPTLTPTPAPSATPLDTATPTASASVSPAPSPTATGIRAPKATRTPIRPMPTATARRATPTQPPPPAPDTPPPLPSPTATREADTPTPTKGARLQAASATPTPTATIWPPSPTLSPPPQSPNGYHWLGSSLMVLAVGIGLGLWWRTRSR